MKRAVLLLAAACQASDVDDYPIRPGGGGPGGERPGGGSGGDAGVDDGGDGDGGTRLTGRVCLLLDLRNPTICDDRQDALGLRVSLGTRTTVTTDKLGSFSISAPQGAGFTWHVDGNVLDRIVRTAMPFGTDNTIPAISTQRYQDLLSANSATVGPLQGSIVARVVSGVVAVPRVTAALTGQDLLVLYDGSSLLDWNTGTVGTGDGGVVWIPGVELPVSTTPLTITLSPQGAVSVTTQATVEEQTITFVTKDLQEPSP